MSSRDSMIGYTKINFLSSNVRKNFIITAEVIQTEIEKGTEE
jgi:hypothetical protein